MTSAMEKLIEKAGTLMDALPYIRAFWGKTLVIKYGGHAMEYAAAAKVFAHDVVLLKCVGMNPVIVHGGGPQIGAMMKRLGKEPRFVGGMRVTDEETMEIVEMVLVGRINKEIVGLINRHGGKAVGPLGQGRHADPGPPAVAPTAAGEEVDIGLVGDVTHVNPEPIRLLDEHGFIPVIAPSGSARRGDVQHQRRLVAGEVAAALQAEKLIHLTDVEGIKGPGGDLVSTLSQGEARRLVAAGVIEGGMLPKVESALRTLGAGTAKAHILDGRIPHAILLEIFTRKASAPRSCCRGRGDGPLGRLGSSSSRRGIQKADRSPAGRALA